MALSRNARRAIAKQRKAEKLERMAKRAHAERNIAIAAIVKANLNGSKPERTPKGLTQDYASFGSGSVSPQKHCEAKQKVTVYGRDMNCKVQRDNTYAANDKRTRPDYESWKSK